MLPLSVVLVILNVAEARSAVIRNDKPLKEQLTVFNNYVGKLPLDDSLHQLYSPEWWTKDQKSLKAWLNDENIEDYFELLRKYLRDHRPDVFLLASPFLANGLHQKNGENIILKRKWQLTPGEPNYLLKHFGNKDHSVFKSFLISVACSQKTYHRTCTYSHSLQRKHNHWTLMLFQ